MPNPRHLQKHLKLRGGRWKIQLTFMLDNKSEKITQKFPMLFFFLCNLRLMTTKKDLR